MKTKKNIATILFILICVFAILIPLLPYISIFRNEGVEKELFLKCNGFHFLFEYVGEIHGMGKVCGTFAVVMEILSVLLATVSIINLFDSKTKSTILQYITVMAFTILSLIYMILSFVAIGKLDLEYYYIGNIKVFLSGFSYVWIYFIIVTLLSAGYIVFSIYMQKKEIFVEIKKEKIVETTTLKNIMLLKELLDNGAITQDEYDKKKKEILDLTD